MLLRSLRIQQPAALELASTDLLIPTRGTALQFAQLPGMPILQVWYAHKAAVVERFHQISPISVSPLVLRTPLEILQEYAVQHAHPVHLLIHPPGHALEAAQLLP